MAGNRIYTTFFDDTTGFTTSKNDIWYIKAGAANGIELHGFSVSANVTSPTKQRLTLVRLGGTFTAPATPIGSFTVSLQDSGDTKATTVATANYGNSSKGAVGTGTLVTLMAWQWEMMGELLYLPPPEDRPIIQAGEALELAMSAVLGGTTAMAGWIQWRELP